MRARALLPAVLLFSSACNLFVPSVSPPHAPDASDDFGFLDIRVWQGEDADAAADNGAPILDMGTSTDSATTTDEGTFSDVAFIDSATDSDVPIDMAPPDPCDWPETLFCSGFEDETLGDWSAVIEDQAGVLHVSDDTRSGNGALQVDLLNGGGAGGVSIPLSPPIGANDDEIWVRLYMYWPSDDVPSATFEYSNVGNGPEQFSTLLHDDFMNLHFHLQPYDGAHTIDNGPPRDRWVCLEYRVATGSGNAEVQFFVDGTPRIDVRSLDIVPSTALGTFQLGVVWSHDNQPPTTIRFDDVIVSRRRPHCD